MKIYDFVGAPNPKKVRIYLAEKGIEVERVPVSILAGENRADAFREKNPMMGLPVLELDDGRCFPESLSIMEYFEELHPEPPMIGTTPAERLRVRGLERAIDLGVFLRVAEAVWHTSPFFARRIVQLPDMVDNAMKAIHGTLKVVDAKMGGSPFVAGDRPTIADCTLYSALWFAQLMGVTIDLAKRPNVARWFATFGERPSTRDPSGSPGRD
jgi:glutathione S-transferase